MSNISKEITVGKLIKFNYLYSNETPKIGIICSLKPDANFSYMISILCLDKIIKVPYSVVEIKEIE